MRNIRTHLLLYRMKEGKSHELGIRGKKKILLYSLLPLLFVF